MRVPICARECHPTPPPSPPPRWPAANAWRRGGAVRRGGVRPLRHGGVPSGCCAPSRAPIRMDEPFPFVRGPRSYARLHPANPLQHCACAGRPPRRRPSWLSGHARPGLRALRPGRPLAACASTGWGAAAPRDERKVGAGAARRALCTPPAHTPRPPQCPAAFRFNLQLFR
ncbi:MAG: hypothetical protein J3K34DRAFT_400671 [Monoraphidium minutum]|nr:MAG: hypothetical protein J3K34DRAFT_400671 [Monoraphidium minutum]